MARQIDIWLIVLVLLGAATSCSTSPTTTGGEKFDPVTGVTVTYAQAPLVLYRDNTSKAAFARNFVNLGPVQVNRSGEYRHYLWLGIWNTMHVVNSAEQRNGFESIVIFADGEPLPMEVAGWTLDTIGVSEPVYNKPVASAIDAYYLVTADQIRLIAEARDIRLLSGGIPPREFVPWNEQSIARQSLVEFLTLARL